jgi:hypothetical protein
MLDPCRVFGHAAVMRHSAVYWSAAPVVPNKRNSPLCSVAAAVVPNKRNSPLCSVAAAVVPNKRNSQLWISSVCLLFHNLSLYFRFRGLVISTYWTTTITTNRVPVFDFYPIPNFLI